METTTCRPVLATWGLGSYRARATNLPMGAPMISWVAWGWREVVCGLELRRALLGSWDVQVMRGGGGIWARKGSSGIS